MRSAMTIGGAIVVAFASAAAVAAAPEGKVVYASACGGCHAVMAPRLGDKAQWAPLLKKGTAELTVAVVKGKGAMPPKGGKAALSDAEVKAAVEYMIQQVK